VHDINRARMMDPLAVRQLVEPSGWIFWPGLREVNDAAHRQIA
jgi:hypothetical protein